MTEGDPQGRSGFFGWKNVSLLFFIYGAVYGFVFYGFVVVFPAMLEMEGWKRGDASLAHSLRAVSLGILAPLVAIAVGKVGAKRTMIPGLAFGVVVLVTLGTLTDQLWLWIVLWGFLMPFSFSFGGAIPIQTTLTYWFDVRRATALGIVLSASALGGFVAAPLYTLIMREAGTWKAGWLSAATFCALALLCSLFMKSKPSDIGQYPDGIDPRRASADAASSETKKPRTYRTSETWAIREVLRQPVLYLMGLGMVAQMSAIYLLTTHGKLHLTDSGFSDMQAASAMGNLILFSGLARFPMGILGDRIEPRWIMAVALAGMGVALIGIWRVPEDFRLLLGTVSIFGFCFGSIVPIFPALIGNYFGPAAFAPITGFLSPVMILIGAPVPVVAGMIYDRFGSYDIAFLYVVIFSLVTALLATALVPPKKKPKTC